VDLLTNAIESIQTGVEDYQDGRRPRLLSAVRNIHAGILLLYKEALLRRSPPNSNEALIKAKIEPQPDGNGSVSFVGVGKKTVDTFQIRERFKSLGISTDWKLLEKITEVRNDVEHYFPRLSQDAIAGVLASAFLIIRQFATAELGEEPRDLLGQETWDAMLEAADVYEAERKECDDALASVTWGSQALEDGVRQVRCRDCGSDLLKPIDGSAWYSDTTLECRACGVTRDPDSYIPDAVSEALAGEAYVAMTDGGEQPYVECPDCGLETYIYAEGRCAHCGETATQECERCGGTIPSWEMSCSPLCGYCDHVMSKDD
jgi:ribosomal protein S27E